MPIVTLMTDFGNKDYAVAAVKGAILSTVENPQIVDISHQISPYNPTEAAYILKNAYKNFPEAASTSSVLSPKKHPKTITWPCILTDIILSGPIMVFLP